MVILLNDLISFLITSLLIQIQVMTFYFLPLFDNFQIIVMLTRMKLKRVMERQQRKTALYLWIQTELKKLGYDLSDQYCKFYIKDILQQKGSSIIIQLYIQPLSGTFESIEFKPKVFFSSLDFTNRPRIYNDRRLFHPNINIYTCQIVFPEIIRDWNPTQQFYRIFNNLKYVILQPNLKFVPNTQFNKRAAWNYHFNKKNYRDLIIQNCPLFLDNTIMKELIPGNQNKMEIQSNMQHQEAYNQNDYWSIEGLTVRKGIHNKSEENCFEDEEKSILMLTKQIKCLEMNENIQNRYLSDYQPIGQ